MCMVEFMVLLTAIRVAPFIWAMFESAVEGSGGAIPGELVTKIRVGPDRRVTARGELRCNGLAED